MREVRLALQWLDMRVFISHSASENGFANAVRAALIRHGLHVWNPERELLPGDNWLLEAGRALEQADAVIFLLSADSVDSPFTQREIQYVIGQPKLEHRVFPVRVGKNIRKIPWVLRELIIEAPAADPESIAHEIANRLQEKKPARRLVGAKRRTRLPASSPTASTKLKSVKRETKGARRVLPTS
jgi:hypothetical protein